MKHKHLFKSYLELTDWLDDQGKQLIKKYPDNIQCKATCSDCCISGITLFPIEAFYIKYSAKLTYKNEANPDQCTLLKKDKCSIYPYRPVLCRTQGYPLVYNLEDMEHPEEMELSICEYNFVNADFQALFDKGDVIDMDTVNLELAKLNIIFLKEVNRYEELKDIRIKIEDIPTSDFLNLE